MALALQFPERALRLFRRLAPRQTDILKHVIIQLGQRLSRSVALRPCDAQNNKLKHNRSERRQGPRLQIGKIGCVSCLCHGMSFQLY